MADAAQAALTLQKASEQKYKRGSAGNRALMDAVQSHRTCALMQLMQSPQVDLETAKSRMDSAEAEVPGGQNGQDRQFQDSAKARGYQRWQPLTLPGKILRTTVRSFYRA